MNEEKHGEHFKIEILQNAQNKAWDLLNTVASAIKPGMKESDAALVADRFFKEFQVEKKWHPSKIRFGRNTLCSFRELSDPEVVLQEDDIFFLDFGPVFFNHEGDVGRTFTTSRNNSLHQKAIDDCQKLFKMVAYKWRTESISGPKLYEFAEMEAQRMGWQLGLQGASGHRISEFPHAIFHKGSLKDFKGTPTAHAWILEIQIRHPELPFGAFFEDILY